MGLREFMSKWRTERSSVSSILILVRVGGGYLTLEEFLQINVPIELEKMAQRDPIVVLSKNVIVNKTIAGRSSNGRESVKVSPLTYKNALKLSKETF